MLCIKLGVQVSIALELQSAVSLWQWQLIHRMIFICHIQHMNQNKLGDVLHQGDFALNYEFDPFV